MHLQHSSRSSGIFDPCFGANLPRSPLVNAITINMQSLCSCCCMRIKKFLANEIYLETTHKMVKTINC